MHGCYWLYLMTSGRNSARFGGGATLFLYIAHPVQVDKILFEEERRQLTTTGTLHPGLSAVACVTAGDHLYAYGGFDGRDVCSVLSRLNL